MASHYIAFFTETHGRRRRAVCGTFIEVAEHSPEPSCDICQAWLTQDQASFRETVIANGWEEMFPLDFPQTDDMKAGSR